MRIGVPRERAPGERRVGLVPESVGRLTKGGFEVRVVRGAGASAFCPDEAYIAAGATIVDDAAGLGDCDVVVRVQKPSLAECDALPRGAVLVSLLPVAT